MQLLLIGVFLVPMLSLAALLLMTGAVLLAILWENAGDHNKKGNESRMRRSKEKEKQKKKKRYGGSI